MSLTYYYCKLYLKKPFEERVFEVNEAAGTKGARRRAEILKVARSSLIHHGYDKFSMREIAAKLDTKLGHLQYYFPSKHELIEALARTEFETNLATIGGIAEQALLANEALETTVKTLLREWISEGAKVYAVATFLGLHDEAFGKLHRELNETFYDVLDDLLTASSAGPAGDVPRQKLRIITALIDGALLHSTGNTDADDKFVSDIAKTVLTIARP